ncbi:MAG: aminotransferase class I/II-fold pyridoxal phosphate-dependent enzyme [Schleiferiaceae bacterium]|nr:aminotransferase class I/II-fold pyridoxal phosphate-dependent enzyme [Schleiferiaceae bacterium]MDR9441691.1 aminotransferase class I/II-fold pyridoxal phosphate-dependent enzyme [Schleiferiaceae bacterium]
MAAIPADLPKIWLSSPHLGEQEQIFVNQAFADNWIAPLGPHVNGFEKDLQEYNDVAHAAALSSGTAAMHLALDMLEVGPGDKVICQSFTFCGSSHPVTYLGAQPVFVDSETDSWNMCPQALEKALAELGEAHKPKAIIPVHLYGNPAKMEEILSVAERHQVPVIEDAAESLGSTYHGKKTGSLGTMAIYSFNGNKIITTSGGGALVSPYQRYIEQARFLATQARDEAPHYQHSQIGYNYRLSNVLAGIGRGQMTVLDERIAQRQANYRHYRHLFENEFGKKGYQVHFQEELPHCVSNRWLTTLLMKPEKNKGKTREGLRLALAAQNIEARPLWKPMHLQPVYADAPYYTAEGRQPHSHRQNSVADALFEEGLCLPSGSNLTAVNWQRIEEALQHFFT